MQRYEQPRQLSAAILSVLMHGLLVAALFFTVDWQTRPEPVMAELWTTMPPSVTAPAPEPKPEPKPEPPPEPPAPPSPPPKPDIVRQVEKPKPVKKLEPKPVPKPDPVKKPVKPAEPAPPKFDDLLARETSQLDRLKLERDKQARAEQEAAMLAKARSDQEAQVQKTLRDRALADYQSRIKGKIRGNLVQPPNLKGNPVALFIVNQLPSGEIIEVRLKRASGQPLYDEAVERAIRKSSPLPKPDDSTLFSRDLELTFCPDEDRGCGR